MQMQLDQSLKQGVSQKMIQSAQILQLNSAELQEYLENLSLENPLMEFIQPAAQQYAPKQEAPRLTDEQNRKYAQQERISAQDPWNSHAVAEETLPEALLLQLGGMSLKGTRRRVLEHMIHNLDSNGYLSIPLKDIQTAFGCEEALLNELLEILQSLEPWGVGARNLSECLCIQLRQLHPKDQTALSIARDELELLGKNQLPALAKKLHKPLEEILRACDVIRSLNPRPGAAFSDGKCMQYIHPELLVFQNGDSFRILLNDFHGASVKINEDYLQLLSGSGCSETTAYLAKKKEQLLWVQQCIEQRKETLLSLGNLILEVQAEFFRKGPGFLKTFSQAEAAKGLNVHESTVSRAIRDKYLQCIWGTFPLSHFFPQGLQQRDQICSRLRQLIAGEDKHHPLSDQALSDALAGEGIALSKRMVSKYRSEMNIPDSSIRRKY